MNTRVFTKAAQEPFIDDVLGMLNPHYLALPPGGMAVRCAGCLYFHYTENDGDGIPHSRCSRYLMEARDRVTGMPKDVFVDRDSTACMRFAKGAVEYEPELDDVP